MRSPTSARALQWLCRFRVAERPILFSGAMVRAILDGRKTQTRRVVTGLPQTPHGYGVYFEDGGDEWQFQPKDEDGDPGDGEVYFVKCPYGKPATVLWVRETWGQSNGVWDDWEYHRGKPDQLLPVVYRADNPTYGADDEYWRPSIHMPRWASRITLEVTEVRVERLQDISEDEAVAEGYDCSGLQEAATDVATVWFRTLWDEINAKRPGCSWEDSPWVWAITFRRINA